MSATAPTEVFPVGVFIEEELAARGMTLRELSKEMRGDPALNVLTLELIVYAPNKGMWLDEETARELSRCFGTSADYWLRLDKAWQEHG